MRDELDQRQQIHLFARDIAAVVERVRPIHEILQTAAAVDPEMQAISVEMESYRLDEIRKVAAWLAPRTAPLRSLNARPRSSGRSPVPASAACSARPSSGASSNTRHGSRTPSFARCSSEMGLGSGAPHRSRTTTTGEHPTARGSGGPTEANGELVETAEDESVAVRPAQVGSGDGERQGREATEQRAERDASFEPGQRGTEAEVDAEPEPEVGTRFAG